MVSEPNLIKASHVVEAFKRCGITHIVWLPDSETRFLYDAIKAEPSLTLVPVAREAETMAVAAGLWVGGKEPAVLIQNTGFYESGDSLRGIVAEGAFPLLMVIGWRGWARRDQGDTAGSLMEPVLRAYGIPYEVVERDDQVERIVEAHRRAHEESRAVAVLVASEYRQ
jgi:sulfopyruvate decarboxylase TPP-binding subunit